MDNYIKLRRRKAALKAQIAQQRIDLKQTFQEVRQEFEPANLLKKAVSGALGFAKSKSSDSQSGVFGQLPAPISFLVDVLVTDPKWAFGLKLLTPVLLKYWPGSHKTEEPLPEGKSAKFPEDPVKASLYGKLHMGISNLRAKLRKTKIANESSPDPNPEQPLN